MIQRFNLVFLLKPTACQFLFLQADKTEIFALERMVIVSLFFFFFVLSSGKVAINSEDSSLDWGYGQGRRGAWETEIHEKQQRTQRGRGM